MCTLTAPESDTMAMTTLDSIEQIPPEDELEYWVAKDSTGDVALYQGKPQLHNLGQFDPDARLEQGLAVKDLDALGLNRCESCRVKITIEKVSDERWEWSTDKQEVPDDVA